MAIELDDWSHRVLLAYELEESGRDPARAFDRSIRAESERFSLRAKPSNLKNDGAFEDGLSNGVTAHLREINFSASILTNKLMADIIQIFDTLICSPTGKIFRCPEYLVLHMDRLDWCRID